MLVPLEYVPAKCIEYAERIKAGEALRSVAEDFRRDYGTEDPCFLRLGYYAHLHGDDVERDFEWVDMAMELAR